MTQEIWRDIEGYGGRYSVSNLGRVRSNARLVPSSRGCGSRPIKPQLLKLQENRDGYLTVRLTKDGKGRGFLIHRLVATAFILNPEGKPCINHLDFKRANNRVENLEWCFHRENTAYSRRYGRLAIPPPIPSETLIKIMELLDQGGLSQRGIARRLSVGHTTVRKIFQSRASPSSD